MKVALTIAGSDSSGGAGVQADLKTFHALAVYGVSVLTAITAQNTRKIYSVQQVTSKVVYDQISCLFDDIPINIAKIGMIGSSKLISGISKILRLKSFNKIVLDPVMVSESGYSLLSKNAKNKLVTELIPTALITTPNLYEAEILASCCIKNVRDMKNSAKIIYDMGSKYVVVKGGHLKTKLATDVFYDGKDFKLLEIERIKTTNTHGTGCTFSSAIAAYIARGESVSQAVVLAKEYVTGAIQNAFNVGKGCGPTNHFFDFYK